MLEGRGIEQTTSEEGVEDRAIQSLPGFRSRFWGRHAGLKFPDLIFELRSGCGEAF